MVVAVAESTLTRSTAIMFRIQPVDSAAGDALVSVLLVASRQAPIFQDLKNK